MKARIQGNNLDITPDKLAVMKQSLELFIETPEIEGISPARKISQDRLAKSTLKKLINKETRLNAEEMRIISAAILFLRIVIEESGAESSNDKALKSDTTKYLAIIDELTTFFDRQFRAAGIDIDAL